MAKFLSDEWFSKVKELTEDAGEIEIPVRTQGSHSQPHRRHGRG